MRADLERSLPSHLVPSVVRAVPSLPETASGKTDRNALPNPFDDAAAEPENPALPQAPGGGMKHPGAGDGPGPGIAAVTAGIWARILNCEASDLDSSSDFHALGGDSLAVVEMLAALGQELLGQAAERQFLDRLGSLSENLTLGRVVGTAEALRSTS